MPKETKSKKKKQEVEETPKTCTVDQITLARLIAQKLNYRVTDIMTIIEEEQKLTMQYVKMGYKVVKKNYLTIESRNVEAKKAWVSPLNGKTYDIKPSVRVLVRVGAGFKQYVADRKMPNRICRFVAGETAE